MTKTDILIKHLELHLRFHGPDYQNAFDNLANELAKPKPKTSPDVCQPLPISFDQKKGEFFGIIADHRRLWAKAYPAVNIDQEIAASAAWLVANPKKAPRSNYSRFLNGWMKRTQDKGGTRGFVQSNQADKAEAWAKQNS